MYIMVFCTNCGSNDVISKGDDRVYPHPTTAGISERFIMILCKKCGWSWNNAGAIHNGDKNEFT